MLVRHFVEHGGEVGAAGNQRRWSVGSRAGAVDGQLQPREARVRLGLLLDLKELILPPGTHREARRVGRRGAHRGEGAKNGRANRQIRKKMFSTSSR